MRVHDVGIGLAVAWARRKGIASVIDCPHQEWDTLIVRTLDVCGRFICTQLVDRGPLAEIFMTRQTP